MSLKHYCCVFAMKKVGLRKTEAQQIRLHFRCLLREHKLGKLGWHFNGIRRALSSPILLAGTSRMPRSVKFKDSSRFVRQLSGIY